VPPSRAAPDDEARAFRVARERVTWMPEGATEPLVVEFEELFRAI